MTAGHVFVVRADLAHLACDDIVVPTDRFLDVGDHWLETLGGRRPQLEDLDVDERRWLEQRCARYLGVPDEGPRVWLVDTGGTGKEPIDWYVEGLRHVLEAIKAHETSPRYGRERRLTALPLVGVGAGGARAKRGEVISAVLALLEQRAAAGDDTALVLWNDRDHAAVQHVRRQGDGRLDDDAQEKSAQALAHRARDGELALFLGAGVSASAGLPLWWDLLDQLLAHSDVDEDDAAAIKKLPDARDAATLVVRKLASLPKALRSILNQHRYGLAHALLAALPVQQAVTTNYDQLFETARTDQGRPVAVLPSDDPGPEWLLKLHGDLGSGEGIVLTRDDYLRFGERSGALGGVVQGMLMTKHVLFAGFSFTDENFFRMAHGTRQALESAGRAPRVMGTALELQGDPVKQRLWQGELHYLSMGGEDTPTAARRLEVFLDRVAQLASNDVSFLLDPAYDSLKSDADQRLAAELISLKDRVAGSGPAHAAVDTLLASLGWQRT